MLSGRRKGGFVLFYLCHDFLVGKLVHLDAEIDEDKETDAAHIGVDLPAEGKGIVNAVTEDGNEQGIGDGAGQG